jgi:uncharacterized protein
MLRLTYLVLIGLLLPLAAVAAEPVFPALSGRVVDAAQLLSQGQTASLTRALELHERSTTNQVVVVTLPSLQGYTIEDFGYQLGRHWGIGQKGKDNGVLLIVAIEEREVRIEVGYGLEGQLTDALSRTIIEESILPLFRLGDFPGGIVAGIKGIITYLDRPATVESLEATTNYTGGGAILVILIFVAFVILVIRGLPKSGHVQHESVAKADPYTSLHENHGNRGFGHGGWGVVGAISSGSGSFGGGGGSFGGGGGSGGW